MRILVVEDSVDLADAIADVLFDAGHDVAVRTETAAHAFDDLLELLVAERFDVVLLDLGLGSHDGAARSRTRWRSRTRHPRSLLCTGAEEERIAPLRDKVAAVLTQALLARRAAHARRAGSGRRARRAASCPPGNAALGPPKASRWHRLRKTRAFRDPRRRPRCLSSSRACSSSPSPPPRPTPVSPRVPTPADARSSSRSTSQIAALSTGDCALACQSLLGAMRRTVDPDPARSIRGRGAIARATKCRRSRAASPPPAPRAPRRRAS